MESYVPVWVCGNGFGTPRDVRFLAWSDQNSDGHASCVDIENVLFCVYICCFYIPPQGNYVVDRGYCISKIVCVNPRFKK